MNAKQIIEKFGLQPHPSEGGFFVETYRSEDMISANALPDRYDSPRNVSTAIYYLLTPDTFSHMHRLPTDEIFHFYLGDPVTMLQLFEDGTSQTFTLGQDLAAGHHLQLLAPKNVWQGTRLVDGCKFALLGTTVAPGFDFADYETGEREKLIVAYPEEKEFIKRLTHA